jgi:energy-coupling factor transporter ATP-binding protein EcfA2
MMRDLLQPDEIWCDQDYNSQHIDEIGQCQLPVLYSGNPDLCLFSLNQSITVNPLSYPIMIGRRKELHTLHQLIQHYPSILMTGKRGCGKTMVVQQIAYDLQLEGRNIIYVTTFQQVQHLSFVEDNAVYIVEPVQRDECPYKISNLLFQRLSKYMYQKNFTIITVTSIETNDTNCCYHYILPSLHIEDFKAYGQQLGITYSNVQYQLLYHTVAGDARALPLLKNYAAPKTRDALLQQLKVITRYLQALENT